MRISQWLILSAVFLLSSCISQETIGTSGDQSVAQNPSPSGPAPTQPVTTTTTTVVQPGPPPSSSVFHSAALVWGDPQRYQADLKLTGDVNYVMDPSRFSQTALTFNGIVKSNSQPRDIVLVVDVSGSTQDSDPTRKEDGKCARYEAVRSVINLAKAQSNARFAVITFDTHVVRSSRAFYSSLEDMFPGESPKTILCQHGESTNYTEALEAARETFINDSINGHLKELYFVSDGLPRYVSGSYGYECSYYQDFCSGIPQAQALKNSGVILGTVMLGNDSNGSAYLRDYIAGMGPDNQKLHVQANDASQLVEKLSQLAADNLVSGRIYYRDMGTTLWRSMDMVPITQAGEFRSFPILFDSNLFPNGMEVQIRYSTSRGFSHSGFATIRWQ